MRIPGFDKIATAILDGEAARRVSTGGANQSLSAPIGPRRLCSVVDGCRLIFSATSIK